MWVMLVVLGSCITNLVLHTGIVMSSKQTRIPSIPGPDHNGAVSDYTVSHLHKAVAQGHCCTVTLVLLLYVIIMLRSLTDLNWANAFYPAAPGLVWLAGCVTLSFLTVIWITSIIGAVVSTAIGDYNSLFCTLPTTSIACIIYPVIHEIGTNGLMVCTSQLVTTLAILYTNLALASSFTLTILDHVEFDPVKILPRFMRTAGDRMPSFRIYSLIHGLCTSTALVLYSLTAHRINLTVVIMLLSMNGIMTLVSSLGLGRFFSQSLSRDIKVEPVYTNVPTAQQVGDTIDTDHGVHTDRPNIDDRRITMLRVEGAGRRRARHVTTGDSR
ncbi:hypothetical protein T484DRAFT_1757235 [Baffinella frigidus]|nr:hypothetical protein T484DRAFT_1757235 [Cryptophyta sp. CCMP2293]